MIGSIGSSYTGFGTQPAAKRTSATSFEDMMTGAENSSASGVRSSSKSALQASPQASGTTEGRTVDFTRMTRSELRDVINSKIRSGELSVDGTEGFVMMMGPSEAEQAGQTDTTTVDFVQSIRDQMEFTKKYDHGNASWLSRLETALDTMQR